MTEDANSPVLSLKDVSFSYPVPDGKPIPILTDLCLDVSPASSIAIMGPSGSGKTTLLNLMALLDRPTNGSIKLAGKDALTASEEGLAQLRSEHIGMIFQQHHLLPQCTALENVLLPVLATMPRADQQSKQRAKELLSELGLSERMHFFPARLSGGERQRVAIARALILEPSLLLADEPTGSLDDERTDAVMSTLLNMVETRNVALVIVTHSDEVAAHCSTRFRLAGRTLQADSAP